ncbi:hypothetical protein ACE1CI_21765 [Aerosakkonemataceae cyanobacterium BLCC-F50]|uniref:Uncharacterized protein n=1 Tax=Floridaenema flaviceps BLCC-F50 TaxID=3153642 RepID=A0ABV4XVT7_9CYAN
MIIIQTNKSQFVRTMPLLATTDEASFLVVSFDCQFLWWDVVGCGGVWKKGI